jgi:DNA-binding LacI/PurR family transcriptional regulator
VFTDLPQGSGHGRGLREILEWFSKQATPVIAKFGRHGDLPIPSAQTIMIPAMLAAMRRLIELGHKRIVMITREECCKPRLSHPEQVFLNELEAAGIKTGTYLADRGISAPREDGMEAICLFS